MGTALQPTPWLSGLQDVCISAFGWCLEDKVQILILIHLLSSDYVSGFTLDVPHASSRRLLIYR